MIFVEILLFYEIKSKALGNNYKNTYDKREVNWSVLICVQCVKKSTGQCCSRRIDLGSNAFATTEGSYTKRSKSQTNEWLKADGFFMFSIG